MKTATMVVLLILLFILGIYLGSSKHEASPKVVKALARNSSSDKNLDSSSGGTPQSTGKQSFITSQIKNQGIYTRLLNSPFSQRESNLNELLHGSQAAEILFTALFFNQREQEDPEAALVREEAYALAQKNSRQSIHEIRQLLQQSSERLSPEDKMRLLDMAANLSGVENELKELAYDTMVNEKFAARILPDQTQTEKQLNQSLSTNFEMMVPIMAYSMALGLSHDAHQDVKLTVDALSAQPDYMVQNKIIQAFLSKNPKMQSELQNEVASAQITLATTFPSNLATPAPEAQETPPANATTEYVIDQTPENQEEK